MNRDFVERRDGGYYITGSRVPLDRVLREFKDGEPSESIRAHYPTLTLEQVYGAITFYLGHENDMEKSRSEREREEDAFSQAHPAPAQLKQKMTRLRRSSPASRS